MGEGNYIQFTGNCPGNVSKDSKYKVKWDKGKYVIGIVYVTDDDEKWFPVSEDHAELVEMVNKVKASITGSEGGAFYINEYRQVIVPCAGEDGSYYLAGEYHKDLIFEFEGKIISGNAVDLEGNPVQPGDLWPGPHPGIPYTLAAGGKDIYFRYSPRPRVEKEVRLSKVIGREKAAKVARWIAATKGPLGGRFYVNEFCQVFAPRTGDYGIDYLYVGKLEDMENWFVKPHVSEQETAVGSSEMVAENPSPTQIETRPQQKQAAQEKLVEKTIEIMDGETGHSYETLFGPYLKGATMIKIVDPYIQKEYQVRNLRDLCAVIKADGEQEVKIRLHTKAANSEEKNKVSKMFDYIKTALAGTGKNFAYYFKDANHDRWILTDTGWKIILSRGLDIYYPPQEKCGLGEIDHTFRRCRECHITYQKYSRK